MKTLTRKRVFSSAGIVAISGLLVAGCAAAPGDSTGTASGAAASDYKSCAVSDVGNWNDKSFNEGAYNGLTQAKEKLGVDFTALQSKSEDDIEPNLEQLTKDSCDIIFAIGFNAIDQVNAAAEANPDLNYVTIDGAVNDPAKTPNLKPVTYSTEQSSYLAGYLAAAYSKSKTVGTFGGMQIDTVTIFMKGFYNGAMAYAKDSGESVKVIGWDPSSGTGDFVGDFADTAKAKQISAGQIQQGADVILPVAGQLFTATAQAISESGTDAVFIGVDQNIAVTSPEYADQVLTSVEKRLTSAVYDVIDSSKTDGFSGDPYIGTLENDGTGLSDFGSFDSKISDDVKSKLDEVEKGIIDGSIDPLS